MEDMVIQVKAQRGVCLEVWINEAILNVKYLFSKIAMRK